MIIAWQKQAAYRFDFLLLVLGPSLVFFFVKLSLWTSIYFMAKGAPVGGLSREAMISYQCYVLMIDLLAHGYNSVNLSLDIRLGRITSHLLHPFSFLEFHAAHWLAFQILQLGVVMILLGLTVASGMLPLPTPRNLLLGLGFTFLVSALWFVLSLGIGLMAFWLEETWVLRVILRDMAVFFSGAFMPLELYPTWLREALFWTPFPYLTWIPARIFSGQYHHVGKACLVTLGWILAVSLGVRWIWRRGLRLYAAAGM
jgi:ABC-2 type transport system permease protein